jgi:hypothetical protein
MHRAFLCPRHAPNRLRHRFGTLVRISVPPASQLAQPTELFPRPTELFARPLGLFSPPAELFARASELFARRAEHPNPASRVICSTCRAFFPRRRAICSIRRVFCSAVRAFSPAYRAPEVGAPSSFPGRPSCEPVARIRLFPRSIELERSNTRSTSFGVWLFYHHAAVAHRMRAKDGALLALPGAPVRR